MGAARSPLYNNPRYRLCGMHVEKLALVLAIVLVVLTLVETVLEVLHNWWNALLLLEIIVLLSIIPAQTLRVRFLYIPFLIFQAFFAVILVLYYANVILGIVLALVHDRNVLDGITDVVSYTHGNIIHGLPEHEGGRVMGNEQAPTPLPLGSSGESATVAVPVPQQQGVETVTTESASLHGTEHTVAKHILSLVVIGIGIVYTALVLIHYYAVVRAFAYMRDERRDELASVQVRPLAPGNVQQIKVGDIPTTTGRPVGGMSTQIHRYP